LPCGPFTSDRCWGELPRQTTVSIGTTAALMCEPFDSLNGREELGPLDGLGATTRARSPTQDHTRIGQGEAAKDTRLNPRIDL